MSVLDFLLLAAVLALAGMALWRWQKNKGCCGHCRGCACQEDCKRQNKE